MVLTVAILPDPASLLALQLRGALNHLLRGQPWLRDRLVPFAGNVAALEVFPARLRVSVGPDGAFIGADEAAEPDVVVSMPALAALALATGDESARSRIELNGDPAFGAVLGGVLRELRWDAEEDLSRVFGDIAARRMAQAGRSLLEWQRQAGRNLLEAMAEYLTEERPVLAARTELEEWVREVDLLRESVDRLEKRIAQLGPARSD